MNLPSGAFIQVRRAGIDADRPHVTAHLVDFWKSQADHDSGQSPIATHDVLTPWNWSHDDPAGRIVEILDNWVKRGNLRLTGSHTKASLKWADGPDVHGVLNHPSMAALKAVSA